LKGSVLFIFVGCATSLKFGGLHSSFQKKILKDKIKKNDNTSSPMLPEQFGPDGRPSV
jgi:hypothetical protein